jgi:hypothetical protein
MEVAAMIANTICGGFASLAALLVCLRRTDRTGRASFLMLAVGFAFLAFDFATTAKHLQPLGGLTAVVVGMAWLLLDAYGCLEWTKRSRE